VDTVEMKAEARRSMGVYGQPVSVTLDTEVPQASPARIWGALASIWLAFAFGVLLSPERGVPPLPPPRRFVVIPVTLYAAPLPAPRPGPHAATARTRRPEKPRPAPSGASIKEPLFP